VNRTRQPRRSQTHHLRCRIFDILMSHSS
jgi:hypothetical protein